MVTPDRREPPGHWVFPVQVIWDAIGRRGRQWGVAAIAFCLLAAAPARADWSPAVTVSPADQYTDTPQVSADSAGDAAIVWSNRIDSYNSSVEVSVRQGYGSFSAPQMISVPPPSGQNEQNTEPSVSVGPGGQVAVAWSENNSSGDEIETSFGSTNGGAFTTPQTIEGPEPGMGVHNPQISIDSQGDVTARLDAA